MAFFEDVKSLLTGIEDLGNPFLEASEDLVVLDTKEIVGPAAVGSLRQIEAVGREQCNTFITERLVNRTKSLYEPIKRNNFSLFNSSPQKETSRMAQQLSTMKSDVRFLPQGSTYPVKQGTAT